MQTKRNSLIESITQTVAGFFISLLIQLIIYPALGIPVTIGQNLLITSVFTFASIGRGFVIRRLFNKIKYK
jgi:hypothetical protein